MLNLRKIGTIKYCLHHDDWYRWIFSCSRELIVIFLHLSKQTASTWTMDPEKHKDFRLLRHMAAVCMSYFNAEESSAGTMFRNHSWQAAPIYTMLCTALVESQLEVGENGSTSGAPSSRHLILSYPNSWDDSRLSGSSFDTGAGKHCTNTGLFLAGNFMHRGIQWQGPLNMEEMDQATKDLRASYMSIPWDKSNH